MIETFILAGIIVAIITMAAFRFYRNPKHLLKKPDDHEIKALGEDEDFLLEHYDKDQIVLMVRDPEWLFAYWEITATKQKQLSEQLGHLWHNSTPVLRVYDVAQDNKFMEENYFDIRVNEGSNNWYIHVGKPNHSFFIDLGRLLPNGSFLTIVRSNLVTTPSNSISCEIDPNWLPIEAIWVKLKKQGFLDELCSSPELLEER